MSVSSKHKEKASKGLYLVMALSMAGISSIPVFFKVLFSRKPSVATVNGSPISHEEYRYAVAREERLLAAYRERLGSEYRKILSLIGRSEHAEETVLEQLIVEKLLLGVAQQIPLELSSAFISMELSQLRTLYGVLGEVIPPYLFTEQGQLRVDVLRKFLQSQGLTFNHFEAMVEQLLKEQLVMKLVQGSVAISESELSAELMLRTSPRELTIETIPLRSFEAEAKERLADDAITAFYESQNRASSRYWSPERRSGTLWTFDLSKFSQQDQKDQSKDQSQAENNFQLEAESAISSGQLKDVMRFVEKYQGKQGSLKKIPRTDDAAAKALFSIESLEGYGIGAAKGRGYIVKLEETISREQIPLESIREEVTHDMLHEQEKALARASLSSGSASEKIGYGVRTLVVDAEKPFSEYGKTLSGIKGLVVPGQSIYGTHQDVAYRMRLKSIGKPHEALMKQLGEKSRLQADLWERKASLLSRDFIASLRDHAILSVHEVGQRS